MERCPFCGFAALKVGENLCHCLYCNQYFNLKTRTSYRHEIVHRAEELKELAVKPASEAISLSESHWKLVKGVSERLSYDVEMRRHFRDGLANVLGGKTTLEEWIEKTRTETGLKDVELYEIIYDEMRKIPEVRVEREARQMMEGLRKKIQVLRELYPR